MSYGCGTAGGPNEARSDHAQPCSTQGREQRFAGSTRMAGVAAPPASDGSGSFERGARPRTLPSHIFFLMNISQGLPWPGDG